VILVPACTAVKLTAQSTTLEVGTPAAVSAWYDAQPAYRRPLLDLLSFLSVGHPNVGVVIVNKDELDHLLLWPVPEDGFSGTYPGPDPWATTLHHLAW
jgi:hypothetical protein